MLKKDARKIKAIMRMSYTNLGFFRLKGDNIIMRPKSFTLRKEVMPILTFITNIVPSIIAATDKVAADSYAKVVKEYADKKDVSKLYAETYNIFTIFVQRNQFKGVQYEFSERSSTIGRYIKQARNWIIDLYKRSLIKKAAEAAPEKLRSMEEILGEELKVSCQEIGRIITGNPKFDEQHQQIMRYTSIPQAYL